MNYPAAKPHCGRLLKERNLIPNAGYTPAFAEYAEGWREWETQSMIGKNFPLYPINSGFPREKLNHEKNEEVADYLKLANPGDFLFYPNHYN